MTFQNKSILFGLVSCLIVCTSSCTTKRTDRDVLAVDTISMDGLFFANEKIIIQANNEVVYNRTVDSSRVFQTVYDEFIIDKSAQVRLKFQTFFNNQVVIDTAFDIPRDIYLNSIGGSICYPAHLSEDSLKKIQEPHFGFIPIDSCKRYITLMPDSIMHRYIIE